MRKVAVILFLCIFSSTASFSQNADITEENGKYGLFDKNHGVIIDPVCEKIISKSEWGKQIFILKKGNKYAYSYFRNLDSLGKFGYLTPHWEISAFVFDELVPISNMAALRYKKNEKYGLIFVRTHFYCDNSIFRICSIDGLGEVNITEALYDEPFWFNDDKIVHVKKNNQYQLFQPIEVEGMGWINYTYSDVFDSIVLYPDYYKSAEKYYRLVKKDGKWGLIKINPEIRFIEYIVPCINNSYKNISSTSSSEVFYTKKAVNDTIFIYDTKNKIQLKLNIPTDGDLKVDVKVLKFYSNYNIQVKKNEKHYLMVGLCEDDPNAYRYKEITIIDNSSGIKAAYNDTNAEYILHKNQWGALIGKKTNTGKEAIHEFFDVETGEKVFTIKTDSNAIISSCELDLTKIPLVIENGKKDKMVGYYDFSTKKYYKSPPKKDERCHGF